MNVLYLGKALIHDGVNRVLQNTENIKTLQNGVRELDIFGKRALRIVAVMMTRKN